jgi:hypothetical protein
MKPTRATNYAIPTVGSIVRNKLSLTSWLTVISSYEASIASRMQIRESTEGKAAYSYTMLSASPNRWRPLSASVRKSKSIR